MLSRLKTKKILLSCKKSGLGVKRKNCSKFKRSNDSTFTCVKYLYIKGTKKNLVYKRKLDERFDDKRYAKVS